MPFGARSARNCYLTAALGSGRRAVDDLRPKLLPDSERWPGSAPTGCTEPSAADREHLDRAAAGPRSPRFGARSSGRRARPRLRRGTPRSSSSRIRRAAAARRSWPVDRRTGRCRAGPRPTVARACSRRRTAAVTEAMTPTSPLAVAVPPALGDLAAVVRVGRLERQLGVDRGRRSRAAGTTSSSRQPLEWPTSMYSMNRRIRPSSRAQRAIGRTLVLVDPALDDHVDLDRRKPGLARGRDPVEHLGDREVDPVHRPEHRVVERVEADGDPLQPGVARSGPASARRAEPFVVSVRSTGRPSGVRSAASISTRCGRLRRTSGSPPVIRSFSTPRPTKIRASRSISSNDSTCSRGRNSKSRPKISLGMQ